MSARLIAAPPSRMVAMTISGDLSDDLDQPAESGRSRSTRQARPLLPRPRDRAAHAAGSPPRWSAADPPTTGHEDERNGEIVVHGSDEIAAIVPEDFRALVEPVVAGEDKVDAHIQEHEEDHQDTEQAQVAVAAEVLWRPPGQSRSRSRSGTR